FIYYPAIHHLAESFSVPVSAINLTVTSYMAVATIAPTLVGDTANAPETGVRGAVECYQERQKGGGFSYSNSLIKKEGTFSIAYGVITDVASPAERGSYVSMVSFAITIAPSIGPILGGTLSYAAGWQWIFWFLCIAAASCLSLMIFFLPETSRSVVDNGSLKSSKYLRLPLPNIMCHWKNSDDEAIVKWRVPNPLKSLKIIARRDNAVVMVAGGLLYVIYTCINTALSVVLIDIYGLNQWQAGLTYLPFGLGGMASTFFSGPLIDKAYRNFRLKMGLPTDRLAGDDLDNFPIERARLGVIWTPMLLTACSVMGFGWVVDRHQRNMPPSPSLSPRKAPKKEPPFQLLKTDFHVYFKIYNTLLVDKNYRTPAAAQASSNIVRCSFAAIAISFLQDLIDAIGIGWTFPFLSGLCLVAMGLFAVDFCKGTSWRQKRFSATLSRCRISGHLISSEVESTKMHCSWLIALTAFITLSLAIPAPWTTGPDGVVRAVSNYSDSFFFSIPTYNVICAIPNPREDGKGEIEPPHIFAPKYLKYFLWLGKELNRLSSLALNPDNEIIYWPKKFSSSQVNQQYPIVPADKCNLSGPDVYYMPLANLPGDYALPKYDSAILPRPGEILFDGSAESQEAKSLTAPVTPDVLIFELTGDQSAPRGIIFCAVATNAQAPPEQQLYVDGMLNRNPPGGYTRCNEDVPQT
ncbi:MAG: hypothetical protein Q9216_006982, partial [Gyalolechia sp. 2 TL-2023]